MTLNLNQVFNADVIASAGSPTKRNLLKTLGVKHVIDSRRGDFAESVMELTGGRGADVVLNALAAEAIPMGLSCLAESDRFLEIGKRDIYMNSRIPLKRVFHLAMVIDYAALAALTAERLRTVMAPKAHGAWLSHEATQDMDLDAFVMFSSVSSIFGNPAQGNYSAANAFLDSLKGVEIETMLESSIGVALPPTSLMRARTIGQIATLIAGEMGGDTDTTPKAKVVAEVVETSELDLDSIFDDDLDLSLGGVNEEVPAGKS